MSVYDGGQVPKADHDPSQQIQFNISKMATGLGSDLFGLIDAGVQSVEEVIKEAIDILVGFVTDPGQSLEDLADWVKTTLTSASPLNALNLFNPVPSGLLQFLPVQNISNKSVNLLINGTFETADSIPDQTIWQWDGTQKHSATGGSATTVANGITKVLLSDPLIEVDPGQTFNWSAWARWQGLVGFATNPITIGVVTYRYDAPTKTYIENSVIDLQSLGAAGTDQLGWVQLSVNNWMVPANTDAVRMKVKVKNTATAGSVWFSDLFAGRTQLLGRNLVDGLESMLEGFGLNGLFDASFLKNLHLIPDGGLDIPGFSQIADKLQNGLFKDGSTGNPIQAIEDGIGQLVDFIRQGADGTSGTGSTVFDPRDALNGLRESVAAANAKIAQIISSEDAGPGIVGATYSDDGERTVAGSWGPNWALAGNGSVSIDGHNFIWDDSGSSPRSIIGRYTLNQTFTDYQLVQIVMPRLMESPGFFTGGGPNASNGILARMNAAGDSYIYARIYYNKVELGCVVNGSAPILWRSQPVKPSSGARWALQCGTSDNARQFLVQMNGATIINYTDDTAQSQMGVNNRWGGQAMWSDSRSGGEMTPGSISIWALSDEQPSGIVGTTFRCHRTNAAQMNMASGAGLVPSNFYDTVDFISADLTYLPNSNCGVKVAKAGTYMVNGRIEGTGAFLAGTWAMMGVYKNGILSAWGPKFGEDGSAGLAVPIPYQTMVAMGGLLVYANAGDIIQPATRAGGFTPAAVGDSTGTMTYWAISKVG